MKDEILARMYVLLTLLALVPLLVAVQVVRVSLFQGSELREQGARQASSQATIPAMRGTIVDREGRTLAVNTARYDIAADPTVPGFDAGAPAFFDRLARITGRSSAFYRDKVRRRSSPQYVLLERGVGEAGRDRLVADAPPGIIVSTRFSRRYNYGSTAAHLLGHVDTDLKGRAGIESTYDAFLQGKDGRQSMQRDRRGVTRLAADGLVVDPQHGETVVLTIDLIRQTVLEEELARGVEQAGANWGTAIAIDPETGAILALANVPTYDPNRPGDFDVAMRRNHAVTDRIEPGSTFKLVTAIAAIEEGVVELEDSIDTGPGWMVLHGHTLRDTHPLGTVTFKDVIAQSSNVGVAKVAEQLEPAAFYAHARALGFGMPTWIDMPGEVQGSLKKPADWSGTTLTSMSRGYEVEATPLQLLIAYAALANGGTLVQPYVVAERRDVTGRRTWTAPHDSIRRAFRSSTARTLLPAFEAVVEEGTATQAQVEGVRIAGKTGTAWKTRDGSYASGAYRASFVGFYPAHEPEVAMIVILDEPRRSIYGGAAAAPIFSATVRRWLASAPSASDGVLADSLERIEYTPSTPDVVDWPARVAESRIRAAGLSARSTADAPEARVIAQEPEPGRPARRGARVSLDGPDDAQTESDSVTMPDLAGLTAREASWWLLSLGVTPRLEGGGLVKSQSPAPGAPLPRTAVVRLR